jgi:DNA-directed RNA polymerase specialized sigma24 family protein
MSNSSGNKRWWKFNWGNYTIRYGDIMYSLALQILISRQEAEDLVQEIFLTLWRSCT